MSSIVRYTHPSYNISNRYIPQLINVFFDPMQSATTNIVPRSLPKNVSKFLNSHYFILMYWQRRMQALLNSGVSASPLTCWFPVPWFPSRPMLVQPQPKEGVHLHPQGTVAVGLNLHHILVLTTLPPEQVSHYILIYIIYIDYRYIHDNNNNALSLLIAWSMK